MRGYSRVVGFLLFCYGFLGTCGQTKDKEICNSALGMASGVIPDESISSEVSAESSPFAARLGNSDGSWCFTNESVQSRKALLTIDLGSLKFLSGLASQGPPESLKPKSYSHLVAFEVLYGQTESQELEFNEGNMFFDTDKNSSADIINYHAAATIKLTRFVKIKVTLQVSGPDLMCLRFELYGCNIDVQPTSSIQATTTIKGRIQVQWDQPYADNTLTTDNPSRGLFSPGEYSVSYQPLEGEKKSKSTNRKDALLDDVRLGATYMIQLQCIVKTVFLECGKTEIEAYPPCPDSWSGGNEYHCFWLLDNLPFSDARKFCLDQIVETLGPLGSLVNEDEQKFVSSRILPKDIPSVWIVSNACQVNEDCCQIGSVRNDGTIEIKPCGTEKPSASLCIRDHKGEGSRLRVSSLFSLNDGTGVIVIWRYEGDGWKTDELQMQLWTEDSPQQDGSTFRFSTLVDNFQVPNLKRSTMYRFLLRPAPNIRTLEQENGFIIFEFPNGSPKYAAFLTPVPSFGYILWSGTLRVTWNKAEAKSDNSIELRTAEKYVIISQQQQVSGLQTLSESEIMGDEPEYRLTPVAMESEYIFQIKCYFLGKQYHCADVIIKTDPPNLARKLGDTCFVYDVINETLQNWVKAEQDCKQRSGHLLSILDGVEGKDVLRIFPNKNALLWTGAKLGRKASGYWTDGTMITDLPMAKTSGVTSSAESCCRAVNEAGKLRLSGGNCTTELPYICKYKVEKLLNDPEAVQAKVESWDSIQVDWGMWKDSWLPSETIVYACPSSSEGPTITSCIDGEQVSVSALETTVMFSRLKEFTTYDISLQAWLRPLDIKTEKFVRVMTYPKNPVQYMISSDGIVSISTPILVATGRKDSIVEMTITPLEDTASPMVESTGSVEDQILKGLVPGQKYRMDLKAAAGDEDWTHVQEFMALPTCAKGEIQIGTQCYGEIPIQQSFSSAKEACNNQGKVMWKPKDYEVVKQVAVLATEKNFWLNADQTEMEITEREGSCDKSTEQRCCFYEGATTDIVCTCCNTESSTVCSYEIKADLGKVDQLAITTLTYTSFIVKWTEPATSWLINTYEVQYSTPEDPGNIVTEMVKNAMELPLKSLKTGADYVVNIKPYATPDLKGENNEIRVTTLDPNPQLAVSISENGLVKVTSPRLEAKGRSEEIVKVEVFEVETPNKMRPVTEVTGQAKNVTFDGLKPGGSYVIKITNQDGTVKDLDYNSSIIAYPSCAENQIQVGASCIWISSSGSKSWPDASRVCGTEGEMMFSPKSRDQVLSGCSGLQAKVDEEIWIDVTSSGIEPQSLNDVNSQCSGGAQSTGNAMCCSCDALAGKDGVVCSCCQDTKLFACQSPKKVDLGQVGTLTIEDITSNSVRLIWQMASQSAWSKPTFEVYWREGANSKRRKKRSSNRMLVDESKATVKDLRAGTSYVVGVSPAVDGTPMGSAAEITVTTRDSETQMKFAGLQQISCTMVVIKIVSCCFVILGSAITIFIFLVTRMFYIDCLAHMCTHLGLLAAYMCVLISTSQSYSVDDGCVRADPTLCIASAVLIQFFFQVVFHFQFLEVVEMSTLLDGSCISQSSFLTPRSLLFLGWGIPAIILIISAAVASDDFTDGNDNCWLNLNGAAIYPSVIPIALFASFHLMMLLPILFREQNPKVMLNSYEIRRARAQLRIRWVSFVLLVLVYICWLSGMLGAGNRDSSWNTVFILFSIALGVLLPILRIRAEDQVKDQLKQGLFSAFREDNSRFRVTPSFVIPHESSPPSRMSGYEKSNKQMGQKAELAQFVISANKEAENDIIWHR